MTARDSIENLWDRAIPVAPLLAVVLPLRPRSSLTRPAARVVRAARPLEHPVTDPQTPTAADTSWRCPSTDPGRPNAQCWFPVGHHGRDAVNDFDLHQDEEGNQWPNPPTEPDYICDVCEDDFCGHCTGCMCPACLATAPSTVES